MDQRGAIVIVIEHDLDDPKRRLYHRYDRKAAKQAEGSLLWEHRSRSQKMKTVLPGNLYVEDNLFSLIPSCIPQYSPLQ